MREQWELGAGKRPSHVTAEWNAIEGEKQTGRQQYTPRHLAVVYEMTFEFFLNCLFIITTITQTLSNETAINVLVINFHLKRTGFKFSRGSLVHQQTNLVSTHVTKKKQISS